MEKPKLKISIPGKEALLDPAKLRAEEIAREHKERFERIAKRLLDVVIEEKVMVIELPVVVALMTGKINNKWDGATVEEVLKLGKKDEK